jgi:FkbM family methyltransferase
MTTLDLIFETLAENPARHVHSSALYRLCKSTARSAVEELFSSTERVAQPFGPFGDISMPYTKMGAINSLDLFGVDELIIFAFYNANRSRYKNVIDIGANLGLHSMILARCGFNVRAFEPDPWHYEMLTANLAANKANVTTFKEAVSVKDGEAQFVRVLGNTTGSHLAGSKDSYGEKEIFTVPIRAVAPLFELADFAKIDAEGHEKELLLAATPELMQNLDIMVEIGNPENAKAVFAHFQAIGISMYAQKIGWNRVQSLSDVPTSHREGSLFISAKPAMPW